MKFFRYGSVFSLIRRMEIQIHMILAGESRLCAEKGLQEKGNMKG